MTKNSLKISFSPFQEALYFFLIFKFPVPGDTPGTRSWQNSRGWLPNSHLFLPNLAPFSGDFFAQFWGPRDGPKARDGHHVSA